MDFPCTYSVYFIYFYIKIKVTFSKFFDSDGSTILNKKKKKIKVFKRNTSRTLNDTCPKIDLTVKRKRKWKYKWQNETSEQRIDRGLNNEGDSRRNQTRVTRQRTIYDDDVYIYL